eukprot:CAMPEP_0119127902 /NCGR_PEP_ID=MMETSP1310-20130426/6269_1 /TAXON_ID=464262 /ORGANISM="Genus nov. species nov., Strain RCC2339" /LENGTH=114 /DNA_ID=CAMNT_0007118189 /DNA_START=160 /DNA_END=499 /DNA_ORIENTATION=+
MTFRILQKAAASPEADLTPVREEGPHAREGGGTRFELYLPYGPVPVAKASQMAVPLGQPGTFGPPEPLSVHDEHVVLVLSHDSLAVMADGKPTNVVRCAGGIEQVPNAAEALPG